MKEYCRSSSPLKGELLKDGRSVFKHLGICLTIIKCLPVDLGLWQRTYLISLNSHHSLRVGSSGFIEEPEGEKLCVVK